MRDLPKDSKETPKFDLVFQKFEEAKAVDNLGRAVVRIQNATEEVRRLAEAISDSLEPPPKLYTTT
jgi:hypothetical protein